MHHCRRLRSPEQDGEPGHRWKRRRSRSRECEGRLRYPPRRELARRSRSRRRTVTHRRGQTHTREPRGTATCGGVALRARCRERSPPGVVHTLHHLPKSAFTEAAHDFI
uniref:Uncharacterized protein n=1 Tax=Junco hyemalis TaxID=40217 RepID=A0A8C5NRQ0_JUNHY